MAYRMQGPDSTLNWSHDWSDFLASGESISSRQWTISPDTDGSPSLSGDTSDQVSVSGLAAGNVYHLTEQITTDGGNTAERTIVLRCDQR